jgi:hypothetical protein|eukprot:COSAG01_NODE_152_length_23937_cov_122.193976_33_plen_236_part_00
MCCVAGRRWPFAACPICPLLRGIMAAGDGEATAACSPRPTETSAALELLPALGSGGDASGQNSVQIGDVDQPSRSAQSNGSSSPGRTKVVFADPDAGSAGSTQLATTAVRQRRQRSMSLGGLRPSKSLSPAVADTPELHQQNQPLVSLRAASPASKLGGRSPRDLATTSVDYSSSASPSPDHCTWLAGWLVDWLAVWLCMRRRRGGEQFLALQKSVWSQRLRVIVTRCKVGDLPP